MTWLTLVMLLVGADARVAERIEMVNPGFELDADGNDIPDGWRAAIYGEGFEVAISADQAFAGTRSVRITGRPDHGDRACVLQTTQLHQLPEAGYRLSFAVRGTGVATAIFRLRYAGADGVEQEDTQPFPIPDITTDAWAERSYDFPVPNEVRAAGPARAEIILYQRGEGDLYYDAVRLEKLSAR